MSSTPETPDVSPGTIYIPPNPPSPATPDPVPPPTYESTLLFGVELEFSLLSYDNIEHRTTPEELALFRLGKTTRFLTRGRAEDFVEYEPQRFFDLAKAHIAKTFNAGGLVAHTAVYGVPESIDEWTVTTDASLIGPVYGEPGHEGISEDAEWLGMEVTSPAMPFTPASLEQVGKACELIEGYYTARLNDSCSLHIHIAGGKKQTLDFKTIRNLMTFLYTFEPQINTLHPTAEQNNYYARSTRLGCEFSAKIEEDYGFSPPSALQCIVDANKLTTAQEVVKMFYRKHAIDARYMDYNLTPISEFLAKDTGKPTIEFRQARGTLDPERVCAWIGLLVGIVDYCCEVDQADFIDLLIGAAGEEKWYKGLDGGGNEENLARYGPVPAESSFTIIDLLTSIGLTDSVSYYNNPSRIWPLAAKTAVSASSRAPIVIWEYETTKEMLSDEAYSLLHSKRKIWESFQTIVLAERDAEPGSETSKSFVEHDAQWPVHEWRRVTPAPSEDGSTSSLSSMGEVSDDERAEMYGNRLLFRPMGSAPIIPSDHGSDAGSGGGSNRSSSDRSGGSYNERPLLERSA